MGKMTAKRFKYMFYLALREVSEDWKEKKDYEIKELRDHIKRLKEDLSKQYDMLRESTQAYNKHVHASNLIGMKYELRIMDLKEKIRKQRKELKQNGK